MNAAGLPTTGGTGRPARSRVRPVAMGLLLLSVLGHVLVSALGANPFGMIDLSVYLDAAGWAPDGTLYDSVSRSMSGTGPVALPFTYPPFAALVFLPLSLLPVVLVRVLWQVASVAALAAIIALTLRLLGRAGPAATRPLRDPVAVVAGMTALALWTEPVRTTLNYGQINLFLVLALLAGAAAVSDRWAGAAVGLTAGMKLVPAITGLYLLLQRRYRAVVAAVVVFALTVAAGAVVLPAETWRYFRHLIFDPARTGPVFNALNQSWRGALARLAGRDDWPAGWAVAVLITLAIAIGATVAALRAGDRLAALLVVQYLGLLVSPISWSHHWVWVIPLLLWCLWGPLAGRPAVRALGIAWAVVIFGFLVSILTAADGNFTVPARPWLQAWSGAAYAVLGLATIVIVALGYRRPRPVTA